MRRIDNKTFKDSETYAQVLTIFMERPENGRNTSYRELQQMAPILTKLDQCVNTEPQAPFLLLEEAEWMIVCDRVKSPMAPLAKNSLEGLTFVEDILAAPKAEMQLVGGTEAGAAQAAIAVQKPQPTVIEPIPDEPVGPVKLAE